MSVRTTAPLLQNATCCTPLSSELYCFNQLKAVSFDHGPQRFFLGPHRRCLIAHCDHGRPECCRQPRRRGHNRPFRGRQQRGGVVDLENVAVAMLEDNQEAGAKDPKVLLAEEAHRLGGV